MEIVGLGKHLQIMYQCCSTSSKVFVIGQIMSQFSHMDRGPPPPLSPPPERYKTSTEMQYIKERQKREWKKYRGMIPHSN